MRKIGNVGKLVSILGLVTLGLLAIGCDEGPHGYYPSTDYPYTYPFKAIIKNEPNKFTITGDGANFSIDTIFNLAFDSGRPSTRMQVRSTNAHITTVLTLTYNNNGSWVETKNYVVNGTQDWVEFIHPNNFNELHVILTGYTGDLELVLEAY